MQGKYSVVFIIYCLVPFGLFIEADASVAKNLGSLLKSNLKKCKGAEHLSDAKLVEMLTASNLKESDQCLVECMLENMSVVHKNSQLNVKFIKDIARNIQIQVPKQGVDYGQELLNCDYKPKNNVCLAGFKEYTCMRKVTEEYLSEGLFN